MMGSKSRIPIRLMVILTSLVMSIVILIPSNVSGSYGLEKINVKHESRTEIASTSLIQQEDKRLDVFTLEAPQLRINFREIFVYLPPDYFTSKKSYPVLYLHDGGMVFSTNGKHDGQFDTVLDQMFETGKTEGIIAVGIASTDNRWDEYSPWVNENMVIWWGHNSAQVEGGEGDAYLSFIIDTLKPEIDNRYRTLPDRENTAIGGFSMGGLISLYAGLKHPDVFSKVIAQSTAVWFAEADRGWHSNNQLVKQIKQEPVPDNVKFYLDIGTNEWVDEPMPLTDALGRAYTYPFIWVDGTVVVFNTLETHGVPKENLLLIVEEGGEHEPAAWRGRFLDAMLWLWDGPEIVVAPDLVTVVPPLKAVIVHTPTQSVIVDHIPTAVPEIQVVGVERNPNTLFLLIFAIGLVSASVAIFFWLFRLNHN